MCTTDIFPFVNPDGSKYETRQVHRCSASKHGQPCQPEVFKHATRRADAGTTFPYTEMPPSPRYTPRTSTPVYQSGTESERSNKSNSSKKRRSGIYVNGTKVLDLNRKRHSRNERIVIVDSPPTPRTPPQTFNYPHTAPPSPNMSGPLYNIVDASPARESLRPVIVDERPRPQHVKIEVVDNKSHRRHHSNSSHNSSSNSDSERRRRRDEEERAQDELRRQKIRARIQRANDEIARRQPVPYPIHKSSTYIRPGVEMTVPVERSTEQDLVDAVRQLNLRRNMLDEEAAQRERLRERQLPRRRATVGPGSRRHRVVYDDGTYRWE